mgnify:CR=1 FL=1
MTMRCPKCGKLISWVRSEPRGVCKNCGARFETNETSVGVVCSIGALTVGLFIPRGGPWWVEAGAILVNIAFWIGVGSIFSHANLAKEDAAPDA